MIQLPDVKPSRWRVRDAFLDALAGFSAFGAAILAALRLYGSPGNRTYFMVAMTLAAIALVASVIKAVRSVAKEHRYEPLREPKEIAGWASGCYKLLDDTVDPSVNFNAGDVRLTVYRVVYDKHRIEPEGLQQIISYVGGSGGPPGRTVSARSGIIGVCSRLAEVIVAGRESADDIEAFRHEMIERWGYTAQEARNLSPDRWSFMACPLTETEDGPVIAVIYLDAKVKQLFEIEAVQESVIRQSGLLAEIVRKCYT